jgi:hypothetical protein
VATRPGRRQGRGKRGERRSPTRLASAEMVHEQQVFTFSRPRTHRAFGFVGQEGDRMHVNRLFSERTGREEWRNGDGPVATIAMDL